jgi:hypothetical protein
MTYTIGFKVIPENIIIYNMNRDKFNFFLLQIVLFAEKIKYQMLLFTKILTTETKAP